jgi:hypothetical protein
MRNRNASEGFRAEKQKLELLQRLVSEGFQSLDQGQGVSFSNESEFRAAIAEIGRRSVKISQDQQTE